MSDALKIGLLDASRQTELRATAALFTDAFVDNALFVEAFPSPKTRRDVLTILFDALVADAALFGGIHVAKQRGGENASDGTADGAIVGALMWYPPGAYPMTPLRIARQLPRFLSMLAKSPGGVFALRRAQEDFDRRRPQEPHCHASFLAGRAGERVSLQLSRALLREADANGWPLYLETQNARSVSFYRRVGCELIADAFECFPGGPPTWTMWRPPGGAQNRLRPASQDDTTPLAAE